MADKTPGACQCHEKHAPTYWKGVVREYKDALEKAESRPLTPDAITDEMVERGVAVLIDCWPNARLSGRAPRIGVRELLTAALTEPPARPEGAEDLDPIVDEFLESYWRGDIDGADATDWLAERGVRVTGGN